MTDKPISNPLRLNILGQAMKTAGEKNGSQQMIDPAERALRMGQKAMREGRAGVITDGDGLAIVER